MPIVHTTLEERFWAKVAQDGDCWVWTAYRDKDSGYGRFQNGQGNCLYAHRFAYEAMVADIPEGLHIDHLCRNRACVNPYHLEPVTPRVNTNRSPLTHGSESHCPQGHAYSGDNLYTWTNAKGHVRRYCRACNRTRVAEWHAARRQSAA